jgi:hypothetical protein
MRISECQGMRRYALVDMLLPILVLTFILIPGQVDAKNEEASKDTEYRWLPEADHPCTVQRKTWDELYETFGPEGIPALYETPLVVLSPRETRNGKLLQLTHRDSLLANFPPAFNVTLSSSNSFSEHRRTIPLQMYLAEMSTNGGVTSPQQLSNESWYLFGETYTEEWKQVTQHYELPPCQTCSHEFVALSFGIGNRGSGVQWHIHGPGFSEALHGRKHWILYPPEYNPPHFHHDQSTRHWMETVYTNETKLRLHYAQYMANVSAISKSRLVFESGRPYECTLNPGDLIYFPDRWHHATLNCDPYTAFISTFTSDFLFLQDQKRRQKKDTVLFRTEL